MKGHERECEGEWPCPAVGAYLRLIIRAVEIDASGPLHVAVASSSAIEVLQVDVAKDRVPLGCRWLEKRNGEVETWGKRGIVQLADRGHAPYLAEVVGVLGVVAFKCLARSCIS